MNPNDAVSALDKSLSNELYLSTAWSPPEAQRNHFLKENLEELKRCTLDPYPIHISPGASARAFCEWEDRPYRMYVVAKADDDHVLFLNTETGLFSLGAIQEDGAGTILGFASEEALAAWVD